MKRGMGWPIGIVAILVASVGLNFWMLGVANDDPSFAIEPDYYQKAVHWDSTMAQMRENAALAWRLSPSLGRFSLRDGARLEVTLTDASGVVIPDATIRVAAFFNARANDVYDTTLLRDSTGYTAVLPVRHRGVWELRFDVVRGGRRFTSTARVEAIPMGAGT